jgi:hypothetical protein
LYLVADVMDFGVAMALGEQDGPTWASIFVPFGGLLFICVINGQAQVSALVSRLGSAVGQVICSDSIDGDMLL